MKYLAVTYEHSCGIMFCGVIEVPCGEDETELIKDRVKTFLEMDDAEFEEFYQSTEYKSFEIPPTIGKVLLENPDWDMMEGFDYGEDSDSHAQFGGFHALVGMLKLLETDGRIVIHRP